MFEYIEFTAAQREAGNRQMSTSYYQGCHMKLSAQKHLWPAYAVGVLGLLFAMGASARLLVTGEDSGEIAGKSAFTVTKELT